LRTWIDIANEQNVVACFEMVSRSQGGSMDQQGWGPLVLSTFRKRIDTLWCGELSWNAKGVGADHGEWMAAFDGQQSAAALLKLRLQGREHPAIQQPLPAIQFEILALQATELVSEGVLPRDVPIGGQNQAMACRLKGLLGQSHRRDQEWKLTLNLRQVLAHLSFQFLTDLLWIDQPAGADRLAQAFNEC
jgi:hypothetical protein